jgi:molybdopterin synthase catalytic subunit
MGVVPRILVQEAPFDLGAETAALYAGREDVGGLASFLGICRGDGGLGAMVLEHYPGMTERALEKIALEACARCPLTACTVIHRYGRLVPGDPIVLVAAAATLYTAAAAAAATKCAKLQIMRRSTQAT